MAEGQAVTPYDRAASFETAFADFVPFGAGFIRAKDSKTGEERLFATWSGGWDYQNQSRMYGAYPKSYLERVFSMFPDARRVLHLFSGSLTAEQVGAAWATVHQPDSVKVYAQERRSGYGPVEAEALVGALPFRSLPVQIRLDSGLHPAAKAAAPDVVGDAEQLAKVIQFWCAECGDATTTMNDYPHHRDGCSQRGQKYARLSEPFDLILADPPYTLADQRRYWRESWPNMTCGCGAPYLSHPETQPGYAHTDRFCPDYPTGRFCSTFGFKPLRKSLVVKQCHQVLRPGGWLCWLDQALPMYSKRDWIWRGCVTWVRSTQHRIRAAFFFERRAIRNRIWREYQVGQEEGEARVTPEYLAALHDAIEAVARAEGRR